MSSPCTTCEYLCADKQACCFAVIVEIPWSEPAPFEEYPEECAMLDDLEEWLEGLEERSAMANQVKAHIETLKEDKPWPGKEEVG